VSRANQGEKDLGGVNVLVFGRTLRRISMQHKVFINSRVGWPSGAEFTDGVGKTLIGRKLHETKRLGRRGSLATMEWTAPNTYNR
jgi:hypothetical protein